MNNTYEFGTSEVDNFDEQANAASIYDEVRKELAADAPIEPLRLLVPSRPNFTVVYRPSIDYDLLRSWIRRATNKKTGEVSPVQLAYTVISNTCMNIVYKNNVMLDSEGSPFTVAHREFIDLMGARDTRDAIRRLYSNVDGHMIEVSQEIVAAAGYGGTDLLSDGDETDPTSLT